MKKPILIIIVIVVGVLMYLSASMFMKQARNSMTDRAVEKAIEKSTGNKINVNTDTNTENVKIKTEDGQVEYSTGGDVKVPDSFPKELLVLDDYKVIMSTNSESGVSVTYLTDKDAGFVFQKYQTGVVAFGGKIEAQIDSGDNKMISFVKGSDTGVITISNNDTSSNEGKTTVSVIWAQK